MCSSPSFKNIKCKKIASPIQLKEKLRKDYKNNLRTCRNILLNKIRGAPLETEIRSTLSDIYNNTLNDFNKEGYEIEHVSHAEEIKILEEIKEELIQNEIDWWLEEYERSHNDFINLNSFQEDDSIICMICQKNNFVLGNKVLSCRYCKILIQTEMSLLNIKKHIDDVLERHNSMCGNTVQFTAVSEADDTHIYFICEDCTDMQLVI